MRVPPELIFTTKLSIPQKADFWQYSRKEKADAGAWPVSAPQLLFQAQRNSGHARLRIAIMPVIVRADMRCSPSPEKLS